MFLSVQNILGMKKITQTRIRCRVFYIFSNGFEENSAELGGIDVKMHGILHDKIRDVPI